MNETTIGTVNIMPNTANLRQQFGDEFTSVINGLLFPAKQLWQQAKASYLKQAERFDDRGPDAEYEDIQIRARQMREHVKRVHDAIWSLSMVAIAQDVLTLPADMPDETVFTTQREGMEPESVTAGSLKLLAAQHMAFCALVQDKGTHITHFILTKLNDIEDGLFEPEDEWVVPEK